MYCDPLTGPIWRVSLVHENEAGGRKSIILHVNILYRTFLFLVVIIELFPNSVFQLYCPKDYYYKQKQCNTLQVTIIMEIMNF